MRGVKLPAGFFKGQDWREPRTYSKAEAMIDLLHRRANGLPDGPSELAVAWNWSKWRAMRFLGERTASAPASAPTKTSKVGTKPATPAPASAPRAHQEEPPDFQHFWAAYPRKVGKGAARKAWANTNGARPGIGRILAALEAQKGSEQWTKDDGRFIPHPATWLNQERWEDVAVGRRAAVRASSWRR